MVRKPIFEEKDNGGDDDSLAAAPPRSMSNERKIALFIDFENIAIGVTEAKYKKFEIGLLLERLLEKGKIVAKRAYCDWEKFPDYKREEQEYFRRTKSFPIMHTLLVRTSILQQHPWVARSLFDAWEASKRKCYEHQEWQRIHMTSLWYRGLWEEERAAAGPDIYQWGFRKTRHEVDKMLEYLHQQGGIPRRYQPEELFWPSMLDT